VISLPHEARKAKWGGRVISNQKQVASTKDLPLITDYQFSMSGQSSVVNIS